jgi:hypothetical protein
MRHHYNHYYSYPLRSLAVSPMLAVFSLLMSMTMFTPTLAAQEALEQKTAEPLGQCAILISMCYEKSDPQQISNCLYSGANHAFCEGTLLGKITFQRWIMSPVSTQAGQGLAGQGLAGQGQAVSFLGPQTVNAQCIQAFDQRFKNAVRAASTLEESLGSLQEKLSNCSVQATEE